MFMAVFLSPLQDTRPGGSSRSLRRLKSVKGLGRSYAWEHFTRGRGELTLFPDIGCDDSLHG
jgi:hypothetical protein